MCKKIVVMVFVLVVFCWFSSKANSYSTRCKPENIKKETIQYIQNGQFQKVVDATSVCINENPNWYQMYNNRGLAYKNLGKYDLAIKDFNKTISLNSTYIVPYVSIANLKLQSKDYKGALEQAEKLVKIAPSFAGGYRVRGTAKLCLGDYKGALDDFNKTYSLDPNTPHIQEDINTAKQAMKQKAAQGSNYNPKVDLHVTNTVVKMKK